MSEDTIVWKGGKGLIFFPQTMRDQPLVFVCVHMCARTSILSRMMKCSVCVLEKKCVNTLIIAQGFETEGP
jgi:hypothetical protein